jgi:hypothetical protein
VITGVCTKRLGFYLDIALTNLLLKKYLRNEKVILLLSLIVLIDVSKTWYTNWGKTRRVKIMKLAVAKVDANQKTKPMN